MVSTDQAKAYYARGEDGSLSREQIDLSAFWEARRKHAHGTYAPGQEIPAGTVIDEVMLYTLEDRPLLKERITELLEKRFVEKEFIKQIRLVNVRNLPKHSEILSSSTILLTPEAVAANPWLGERNNVSSTSSVATAAVDQLQSQPQASSEGRVASGNPPSLQASTPVVSSPVPESTRSTQEGLASVQRPSEPAPVKAEPRPESPTEASLGANQKTNPVSGVSAKSGVSGTSEGTEEELSTQSGRRAGDSSSKGSQSWRKNPFKAFVRVKKPSEKASEDSSRVTPPPSPKSPLKRNPFSKFVKTGSRKSDQPASLAVVPTVNTEPAVTPTKKGNTIDKPKKSLLNWGFSQPFSGPQTPRANESSSNASNVLPNEASTVPEAKPNLQPFLDQSVNNTELGSSQVQAPIPNAPSVPQRVETPTEVSPDAQGPGNSARVSAPLSQNGNRSQQAAAQNPIAMTQLNGHQQSHITNGVASPIQQISADRGNSPKSPDLAHQNPSSGNTKSATTLTREIVDKASYEAALIRNQRVQGAIDLEAITAERPATEYFIQLEEYRTHHEIVEQFVQHNYYMLEYAVKTIYMGERRAETYVEPLSRELLLMQDGQVLNA